MGWFKELAKELFTGQGNDGRFDTSSMDKEEYLEWLTNELDKKGITVGKDGEYEWKVKWYEALLGMGVVSDD